MRQPSILIVDDEPEIRSFLSECARRARPRGSVLTASNAQEARGILRSATVDIVVSDHRMPGEDGTSFLSHVARAHPRTIRVLFTGHADLRIALDAINNAAVDAIVQKPTSARELSARLSSMMDEQATTEARQAAFARTLAIAHSGGDEDLP